jgi:hypothetical protein
MSDQVHRHDPLLEEAACEVDALGGEPRQRRGAEFKAIAMPAWAAAG